MTPRQRFLNALAGQPVDRPPVWFMRQAGRHLPEYRQLRERASFLDLCFEPAVCAEASCQPWRRYGVDGVIVFNDILIPLRDMGLGLDFKPGPVFERLVRSPADLAGLATPAYATEPPVAAALRTIRQQVQDDAAVLGFVGAPFTVAAYGVAGPSKGTHTAIAAALQNPAARVALEGLRDRLVDVLAAYAHAQRVAGADVIQVFESCAADVDEATYRQFGLPALLALLARLGPSPEQPVIVFGRRLWPFVAELGQAGATALSLDSDRPLGEARAALRAAGCSTTLQGNLLNSVLAGPAPAAAAAARDLLAQWPTIVPWPDAAATRGPTGWVFNLGHGVPATADPAAVQAVVDAVRTFTFR